MCAVRITSIWNGMCRRARFIILCASLRSISPESDIVEKGDYFQYPRSLPPSVGRLGIRILGLTIFYPARYLSVDIWRLGGNILLRHVSKDKIALFGGKRRPSIIEKTTNKMIASSDPKPKLAFCYFFLAILSSDNTVNEPSWDRRRSIWASIAMK